MPADEHARTGQPERAGPGRSRRLVIAVLGMTQIFAWGCSYYLPAVLARPIAADTGWPFGWVVGGVSLGLLVSGLVSPRVGRAIERSGGRPVLASSALLLAGGLALLATATHLAVYLLGWLAIGLGMGAGLYDAAFATLGRLYGAQARSAITALTLFGGFASTVSWPLSAVLVESVGWRGACLAYAAIQLGLALPCYLYLVPREPRRVPLRRAETADRPGPAALVGAEPGQRRTLFLLLATGIAIGAVVQSVVSVHLMTLLEAGGVGFATAVALGGLIGPSQVGARVFEMLVGRRFHPIWTMLAATALIGAGLALVAWGLPVLALGLVLYGAGNGIKSIARGTLPLALFGPAGYATLMGRLAMPALLAQAAAPSLGAALLEQGSSTVLVTALTFMAAAQIALVLALWLSWRVTMQMARG